jgi:hypothetical protein
LTAETNFNAQARFLNLDPKNDFKHADLSFVDFSHSDLRGFNFSGSNLFGATGVNVQWDHSTILQNARIEDSLFQYKVLKERFFHENRHLRLQVEQLKSQYWTQTITGVAAALRKGGSDASHVAQAVFDEVQNTTVRSNILYFMRLAVPDREHHKAFLYDIIAQHKEAQIVRSAVHALSGLYKDDLGAVNIMIRLLTHAERMVRTEAVVGLLASKHLFSKHPFDVFERVREYVLMSADSMIRRSFVARVARSAGRRYALAARAADVANFLDFAEKISNRTIFLAAEHSLISEKAARAIKSGTARTSIESVAAIKEIEIGARADHHKAMLKELRDKYGIPFIFEDDQPEHKMSHNVIDRACI